MKFNVSRYIWIIGGKKASQIKILTDDSATIVVGRGPSKSEASHSWHPLCLVITIEGSCYNRQWSSSCVALPRRAVRGSGRTLRRLWSADCLCTWLGSAPPSLGSRRRGCSPRGSLYSPGRGRGRPHGGSAASPPPLLRSYHGTIWRRKRSRVTKF